MLKACNLFPTSQDQSSPCRGEICEDLIQTPIGFLSRVLLFLPLIPPPQFSPLLRFRQLPLLSPVSSPSSISSLSTQSVNPRRNVVPPSIAIPVRSPSAAKWTTAEDDCGGASERLSQVYLDGYDQILLARSSSCPEVHSLH